MEDLLKLLDRFDQSSGWFMDFLALVMAAAVVAMLGIHIHRFATGKTDWLGRTPQEEDASGQVALMQLEVCRNENEDLKKQLALSLAENQDLLRLLKEFEQETETLKNRLETSDKKVAALKELYEELDRRFADETYTMTQIMYAMDEINLAVSNPEYFERNRVDVCMNILDYLINTIKDFRSKQPRVTIHVRHPDRDDVLIHYAHSTGHNHWVKRYQPPVDGSAAGKAWRTGTPVYIPDVNEPGVEYHRKEHSQRLYRSILSVPIIAGNELSTRIAVLTMTGAPVDAFDKTEMERVLLFASLLYPLIHMDLGRRGEMNG
ncbi:GAF domain-containing protein [Staphylospora marina]|uniref:GAF domain-containing protein n=1 Tax=Staphylospora marina TaxID=2490858 RepID=UPI000F5BCC55|nr:GAF domain-containing protein [Staphylospora marina]